MSLRNRIAKLEAQQPPEPQQRPDDIRAWVRSLTDDELEVEIKKREADLRARGELIPNEHARVIAIVRSWRLSEDRWIGGFFVCSCGADIPHREPRAKAGFIMVKHCPGCGKLINYREYVA